MKGLDESLLVRSLLTVFFFSLSPIGGSSSRVRDLRRAARAGMPALVRGGRLVCGACAADAGWRPQWVDRIPLHAALHCCVLVVVRALLLGVCAVHLSFPSSDVPVYAAVGTESGMGMMLLQLSGGGDVSTARGGVRGVRAPERGGAGMGKIGANCACRCPLPARRSRIRWSLSSFLLSFLYFVLTNFLDTVFTRGSITDT
jgi:hypothetical protein